MPAEEAGRDVGEAFDGAVTAAASAMVVVTVAVDGEPSGCLVGFHSQCSIAPRRYAVWLSKANRTYEMAVQADHVAVHFLTTGDAALAGRFGGSTGDVVDKFAGLAWQPGPGGVPLLDDAPHRLVLVRVGMFDPGGDHTCLVGAPIDAGTGDGFTPLRLPDVTRIEPGHDADERRHRS
ncbi:MAG: flavin reductase [Acidimicrobiales bacterium]|nr:flavin reductase [Acidimicrobiales bacterium]